MEKECRMDEIKTATNTAFASGGLKCKLGALCFYSSSVLVDSFVLRNPPERKARKRCYEHLAGVNPAVKPKRSLKKNSRAV
jgi:hypothetical protein